MRELHDGFQHPNMEVWATVDVLTYEPDSEAWGDVDMTLYEDEGYATVCDWTDDVHTTDRGDVYRSRNYVRPVFAYESGDRWQRGMATELAAFILDMPKINRVSDDTIYFNERKQGKNGDSYSTALHVECDPAWGEPGEVVSLATRIADRYSRARYGYGIGYLA